MFVYLRGASLSLAVATVVYYLFWVNGSGSWYHQDPSSTHDIFLLILAGCTYGFCVLGYLLFRILQRMNITNRVLRFILFGLTPQYLSQTPLFSFFLRFSFSSTI
ncbi:hypothetical protein ACTHO6_20950, partial [Brevibacillus sp. SAFN-007a]